MQTLENQLIPDPQSIPLVEYIKNELLTIQDKLSNLAQ
jgi:hypothetical protein